MRKKYYQLLAPVVPGFCATTSAVARKTSYYGHTAPDYLRAVRSGLGYVVGSVGGDYADPGRWEEPPHQLLANLGWPGTAKLAQVRDFTQTVAPLEADIAQIPEKGDQFEISVGVFGWTQDKLRRAWKKPNAENLKALWFPEGLENLEHAWLPVAWESRGLVLRPADLWTYIRLLFVRDLEEGRVRRCVNERCLHPHFIASRKDKKYCGTACRNLVMQRNFRNRRTT